MKPVLLQTDRLVLRPMNMNDVDDLWSNCHQYQNSYDYQTAICHSKEESVLWVRKRVADYEGAYEQLLWVIVDGEDGHVIGVVEIHKDELGYTLSPEYRNRGIMTEAVKAVLGYAFAVKGFTYVRGVCADVNIGSILVMERNGMKCYGHCKDICLSGVCDSRKYIIFKEDWCG